jgi:hypothetical protein
MERGKERNLPQKVTGPLRHQLLFSLPSLTPFVNSEETIYRGNNPLRSINTHLN